MYSIAEVIRGLKDPYKILRELNLIYYEYFNDGPYNSNGVDFLDQDWDNMIILDACRFDYFEQRAADKLPGSLEHRISKAGQTREFVESHFSNRDLHDLVYVTGNDWILKIGDDIGADVYNVISVKDDLDWNQRKITNRALEAAEEFPNKRLLIHLIPPHHPFKGPTADEVFPSIKEQSSGFFSDIRKGNVNISDELLRKAYEENLDRAIPATQELLNSLQGKTIVTADHGEFLGERCRPIPIKEYGHHGGLYAEKLVKVPWHVHNGERREIRPEEPLEDDIDNRTPEEIDQRLRELGYKI